MFFQIVNCFHLFFITFTVGWTIKQLLECFDVYPSVLRPSLDWLCIWGFGGLVAVLQIAHFFVPKLLKNERSRFALPFILSLYPSGNP